MTIKKLSFFFIIFQIHYAQGIEFYIVKKDENLSEITSKYTSPPPPLYGKNGRLSKILHLNPQIMNPNLIKAGDKIFLTNFTQEIKKENKTKDTKTSTTTHDKLYDLSINTGPRFYSLKQKGALGVTNFNVIILNNFSLFTSFQYNTYKLESEVYTYQFEYNVNANNFKKQLHNYSLKFSYKNISSGVSFEQTPLLRNTGTSIEAVVQSSVFAHLGHDWNFIITSQKKTQLIIQIDMSYLIDSSTSDSNIKLNNNKGLGFNLKTKFERQFSQNNTFPLFYEWVNNVEYKKIDASAKWNSSSGEFKSSHLFISSLIGLKIKF